MEYVPCAGTTADITHLSVSMGDLAVQKCLLLLAQWHRAGCGKAKVRSTSLDENRPEGVKWEDPIDFMRTGGNSVLEDEFGISKHCKLLWYLWEAWWPVRQYRCGFFSSWHSLFLLTFPMSSSGICNQPQSCKGTVLKVLSTCCSSLIWLISYLCCFLIAEEMAQSSSNSNSICQYHIIHRVGWKSFHSPYCPNKTLLLSVCGVTLRLFWQ